MSNSLVFHNHLLSRGTKLIRLGQLAEGRELIQILLAGDHTPAHVRASARCLLGEIEFDAGHYRNARRHYLAAMNLRPFDPEACLAYARAVEVDIDADPRKGYAACRRAVRVDEFEPRSWIALGRAAIRVGKLAVSLKAFRRAARLQPERIETLAELVNGFLTLGRVNAAQGVLTVARFRSPHDTQLLSLWERFRFDCARRGQQSVRRAVEELEPVVLAFPGRNTQSKVVGEAVVIRADRASRPQPHVLRMFGMRSDPRRAN